jgi:hypothetical protein
MAVLFSEGTGFLTFATTQPPGIKWPEREADHSSQPNAKVKKCKEICF